MARLSDDGARSGLAGPSPSRGPQFLGDDIGDTIDAAADFTLGDAVSSSINDATDVDVFRVSLLAGRTYVFQLEKASWASTLDPYLELRDGAGDIIDFDDDGAIYIGSQIVFTATETTDVYLFARSFSDLSSGAYVFTANSILTGNTSPTPFSGGGLNVFSWDQAALQIARGFQQVNETNWPGGQASWSSHTGAPAVVTYAFRSTAPATMPEDTTGFTRFTAAQITAAEMALASWAAVANIVFLRVDDGDGYSNNATIRFGNFATGADPLAAFAYLPVSGDSSIESQQGDIWVFSQATSLNPVLGGNAYFALVHEIGHAIGLNHPGSYNGGPGQTITYDTHAEYFNDSRMFTVMSYFGAAETGGALPIHASLPQLHDIAAVQRLYGANLSTRTGDTIYGFGSNTGLAQYTIANPFMGLAFAIWDGGGIDTLDLSGYTTNSIIDLRQEAFSSAGPGNPGNAVFNISIARGVVIENAIGGSGNDTIIGNSASNTLIGNGGADSLSGGDGDDFIFAETNDTLISGGAGVDWFYLMDNGSLNFNAGANGVEVVFANGGNDTINAATQSLAFTAYAGAGNDTVTGGSANDNLYGQDGNDTIVGGGGVDLIFGEAGADSISGGDGDDTLIADAQDTLVAGNAGYDYVYFTGAGDFIVNAGANGLEWIFSGNGNDTINGATQTTSMIVYGLGGNDTITGGSGADVLFGQDGNDTIVGGALNDTLWGEGGADSLSGGDGDDTLVADALDTLVSGGAGTDYVYFTGAGDFIVDAGANGVEWVLSLGGNDVINGATQTNTMIIYGNAGNDTITGGAAADVLFGQDGNDTIVGGAQNDTIWGEAGADSLSGGEGDDTIVADAQDTLISGGNGYDFLYVSGAGDFAINAAAAGIEWIQSSGGNDTLNGSAHSVAFTAYGGEGGDTISGGANGDVLFGEGGADFITGGAGGDVLIGGAGVDTFIFANGWGGDLITDFQNGTDRIDMTALAGNGVHSIGDLIIGASGGAATITWNGNVITLTNAAGQIDASDFLFA